MNTSEIIMKSILALLALSGAVNELFFRENPDNFYTCAIIIIAIILIFLVIIQIKQIKNESK